MGPGCSLCQQLPRDCGPEHLRASTWRAQMGHSKHQPLRWDQQSEIPVPVVPALGDGAGLCAGGMAREPCTGLCLWMCPALCPAQPEHWRRLSEQAGCEFPRARCVCREQRFPGTPPQPHFSQSSYQHEISSKINKQNLDDSLNKLLALKDNNNIVIYLM